LVEVFIYLVFTETIVVVKGGIGTIKDEFIGIYFV